MKIIRINMARRTSEIAKSLMTFNSTLEARQHARMCFEQLTAPEIIEVLAEFLVRKQRMFLTERKAHATELLHLLLYTATYFLPGLGEKMDELATREPLTLRQQRNVNDQEGMEVLWINDLFG